MSLFSQDINAVEHYQENSRRGNPFQAEGDIWHSSVSYGSIVGKLLSDNFFIEFPTYEKCKKHSTRRHEDI